MEIKSNIAWVFYMENPDFDDNRVGKWMYFFDNREFVENICRTAVENGVVSEAKHSNADNGAACFYVNCDEINVHRRVLEFFLDNNLIKKTRAGRLYNISFKLDVQTYSGQYKEDFKPVLRLVDFIDLYTAEWCISQNTIDKCNQAASTHKELFQLF